MPGIGNTLPPALAAKLSDFRRRVWIVKLAEGLLASIFGLAVSYLLVLILDRLIETPSSLRAVILIAGAAIPGLGLPLKWHRWVWRQRQLEDAARLLRWKFPRLGDQLLGIVELAKEDHASTGRSERLVQAAMEQADEAVKDQDLSGAVPQARHHQWAWAAVGSLAFTLAGFVFIQAAASNAFERWLMPWRDTERFTFARVDPLPDPLVIPLAEAFTLPIHLGSESSWEPRKARGRIPGQPSIHAQRDQTNAFTLHFPPQTQDTSLSLTVGDVREWIRLEPRPRPELSSLQVRLHLPSYLQYETDPIIKVRGGGVSVLGGAKAAFEVTTSRALAQAQIDGKPAPTDGQRVMSEPIPIKDKREVTFTWKDELGLTPRAPLVLSVNPVEDEAPALVARRESREQVVLDSEVVGFDVTASDDFGVRQVGLEWIGLDEDNTSTRGSKITAAGAPERREVSGRATFCAIREGVAPQRLEVRAWATDYLEGRVPSQSASFTLHVLDKTDHALWVTSQMGKWLEAAKETYEREQQLHQTNKELRSLDAEALDRPENRRRVAQQSSAETANGERLGSLNDAGRKLVEQATKNPEFEAARLESWATLLKSLQDIAGNRMPNVADLLKQSADAKAGKLAASGKTAPQVNAGETSPPTSAKANATEGPQKVPAPSIALTESTMNKAETDDETKPGAPKPPSAGALGLPSNSLAAAPGQKSPPPPPASPAQKKLDEAVTEQKDLLAEFAKVSDQLSEILASLEASTFVKRLKAASRAQTTLASNMRTKTLDAFGIERESAPIQPAPDKSKVTIFPEKEVPFVTEHAPVAAKTEHEQSEVVKIIKSDLEAYVQRRPDQHFRKVIAEMKDTKVTRELDRLGNYAAENLSGSTIHGAEFWADTLDRWAEEMVKAGACSNCSSCSSDSLPPEIVLKVMQALRDEMALRDETRELENAKPMTEQLYHTMRTGKLAKEQTRIREHTSSAIDDIVALPEGARRFGKPLQLLNVVVQVMDEAALILDTPETGAPAIAAETEAIELLLQTKRQNPNGGGGGGNSPGGGGTGTTSLAALTDLGPGSDGASVVQARPVGQATGRAGRAFPEEYKTGLDAYFRNLEVTGTP